MSVSTGAGATGVTGVDELGPGLAADLRGPRAVGGLGDADADAGRQGPWWKSIRVWRFIVLAIAGVYFLIPLWAAFRFSVWTGSGRGWTASAYTQLVQSQGFGSAFWLSVQLALITTGLTLVIMVPTTIYVHLRLPRLRRVMDFVTVLPIVIPPVVLILGVLQVAPARLKATPFLLALIYVVLAMPFAYISLAAGLRAIDTHTLGGRLAVAGGRLVDDSAQGVAPEHARRCSLGDSPHSRTGTGGVHDGQPRPVRDLPGLDCGVRTGECACFRGCVPPCFVRHVGGAHDDLLFRPCS